MLKETVYEFIVRHRLLEPSDRVLVAVSGGPDSLCLLHLLKELAPRLGYSLVVASLDHRFRPESREELET
ncbi:MAG TPA: ATP-binding protein, partial [Bacillota bacterium]|nr:ATP-binding protein [Bacillota bacterium]